MSKKKNILIGICGGISAYKTCYLVRILIKNGHSVRVMMTDSAVQFVTPLTFRTLSKNPVYKDMFELINEEATEHISLAQWADLCVVAPATANTISKISSGVCDNLVTTVICALPGKTKVLLAPAMNDNMWNNPIIQDNIKKLKNLKKYMIIPPEKGELACSVCGCGRMPSPEEISKHIKRIIK